MPSTLSAPAHDTREFSGHQVYLKIIILGCLLHISQVIIFACLQCPIPFVYNVFSTLFYLVMLFLIFKKKYRTIVSCVHVEVCLFTITSTVSCGWEIGAPLYLLAFASLVYFCPYDRHFVPYLFSLGEVLAFFLLYLYCADAVPIYTHLRPDTLGLLYIYSALCCFSIVLFAAFSSKVSATVTNRRLLDENKTLHSQVDHDYLTGLLSRRAFLRQVDGCGAGTSLIFIMGDLDNFKQINDTYGHDAGDYVLRTVAQLFSGPDEPGSAACRWGGEEFLFLRTDTDLLHAQAEFRDLCDKISSFPFSYKGTKIHVTITFGLCEGTPGIPAAELINKADAMLYEGKQSGKNRVIAIRMNHPGGAVPITRPHPETTVE